MLVKECWSLQWVEECWSLQWWLWNAGVCNGGCGMLEFAMLVDECWSLQCWLLNAGICNVG